MNIVKIERKMPWGWGYFYLINGVLVSPEDLWDAKWFERCEFEDEVKELVLDLK